MGALGSRLAASRGFLLFLFAATALFAALIQAAPALAVPQLDKEFTPSEAFVGQPVELVFTITNDDANPDLGWSFTDDLADGLTVADRAPEITCADGGIVISGDRTALTVSGDLVGESCTVTVWVAANAEGTFPNGPGNITADRITPVGDTSLTVVAPAPAAQTCTDDQLRATQRWWFFGNRAGLDFGVNGSAPIAVLNPNDINTPEGSTVVTTTTGDLLFWSNAETVYNRNHVPMPNGTGLMGHVSATQTVAAFPAIEDPGRYFVVTTNGIGVGGGDLYYSVIDMSLEGGLGNVTTKNVALGDPDLNLASEALTAIPNADGTGFWVLTYTKGTPNVLAFLFDGNGPADPDGGGPAGVGDPIVSALPSPNGSTGFGTFALSPDNTELLVTTNAPVLDSGKVRLLGFDAASGVVWQKAEWATPFARSYAVDFSPSGEYAYVTTIEGPVEPRGRLFRYDIANNDTGAEIQASEEVLGQFEAGYVRRGPDGRMYMADRLATSIVVVNDPDNPIDPGLDRVDLAPGANSIWGLPQTITGCPPESDLAVRKASRGPVRPGTEFTYVLTVTNNGPHEAPLAVVTDELPAKVTYVSDDAGCDASNLPQLTCEVGPLAVGASERIRVRVRVRSDARGTVRNRATVTGPNGDPDPGNNEARHAKRAKQPKPRLTLTKRAGVKTARPGGVVPYTITVRNKGKGAATRVRVCDVLPAGLAAVRAPGASKRSAQRVCWRLLKLAAGAKRTLRLTAQVAVTARPGKLRNTAFAKARNARRVTDVSPVTVRSSPTGPCPGAARC